MGGEIRTGSGNSAGAATVNAASSAGITDELITRVRSGNPSNHDIATVQRVLAGIGFPPASGGSNGQWFKDVRTHINPNDTTAVPADDDDAMYGYAADTLAALKASNFRPRPAGATVGDGRSGFFPAMPPAPGSAGAPQTPMELALGQAKELSSKVGITSGWDVGAGVTTAGTMAGMAVGDRFAGRKVLDFSNTANAARNSGVVSGEQIASLKNHADAVRTGAQEMRQGAGAVATGGKQAATESASLFRNSAGSAVEAARETLAAHGPAIKKVVTDTTGQLSEVGEQAKETAGYWAKEVRTNAGAAAEGMKDPLLAVANNLKEPGLEAAKTAGRNLAFAGPHGAITGAAMQHGSDLINAVDGQSLLNAATPHAQTLGTTVKGAAGELAEHASDMGGVLKQGASNLAGTISEATEHFSAGLSGARAEFEAAKAATAPGLNAMREGASSFVEAGKRVANSAGSVLEEGKAILTGGKIFNAVRSVGLTLLGDTGMAVVTAGGKLFAKALPGLSIVAAGFTLQAFDDARNDTESHPVKTTLLGCAAAFDCAAAVASNFPVVGQIVGGGLGMWGSGASLLAGAV